MILTPIKEIDPNDPLFHNLKMEATTVKIPGSKFSIPSFMQKREATLVTPKPKPMPVPIAVVPEPEPIIADPVPEPVKQVRSVDTLPQVKVKVKQSWDLQMMKDVHKSVPKVSVSKPSPAPQPIPVRTTPLPGYVWPKKPDAVVIEPVNEYQYPDSADVYGTRKKPGGSGFKLPSFFQRKEKLVIPTDYQERATITPQEFSIDWKKMRRLILQIGIGVVFVYFGLTSTGSFYEPASRFSGNLATVFYVFQLGTLLTIIGCIIGYDAIRRAGKL